MKLKHVAITPEDQAAIQRAVAHLNSLVAAQKTNFVHDATHRPVPNSRLEIAMKGKVGDAYELARQRLVSAEDHLRSLRTLLGPESILPHFSMFTLTRAAGLATVHARHLLDLTIDEKARFGRALSARLENLHQQHKVLTELNPPLPPPDPFTTWDEFLVDRIDHLQMRATANGIPVGFNRSGAISGFDSPWPSDTDLFDLHMPGVGKTWFKYLSGYAHSLPWAMLPQQRAQPSDEPGISMVPTDVHVPDLVAVLAGALKLYDETVGSYLVQAGYPSDVWTEAKKT
jgi:hypothetical protein